jgi:hypothetical protein
MGLSDLGKALYKWKVAKPHQERLLLVERYSETD